MNRLWRVLDSNVARQVSPPAFSHSLDPKETLALLRPVDPLSLTTLREMLIEIGAEVARHGRQVTFELAVVAIPRALFAEIQRPIDGPSPAPLQPSWGSIQKHPDRPTREI